MMPITRCFPALAAIGLACVACGGAKIASPPPIQNSPDGDQSSAMASEEPAEDGGGTTMTAEGKMTDVPGDDAAELIPDCTEKDECNNKGVFAAMAGKGEAAVALMQKACDMGNGAGCSNLANILAQGTLVARDETRAAALDMRACDLGEPKGCVNGALANFDGVGVPRDVAAARDLFEKGCELGHLESCKNAGVLHWEGKGIRQDHSKAVEFFSRACSGGDASGCFNMGVAHYKGLGVAKDDQKARGYFDDACNRGDKGACDLRDELDAGPPKVARVPGANLTVGSMTANGMTVNDLECALRSMGFMAALQLVGSIAAQKKALDRCAPAGDAVRVTWEMAGGKAENVQAEGAKPKVAGCVKKAASKMSSPMEGKCSAVFLIGKEGAASAAYEKMEK